MQHRSLTAARLSASGGHTSAGCRTALALTGTAVAGLVRGRLDHLRLFRAPRRHTAYIRTKICPDWADVFFHRRRNDNAVRLTGPGPSSGGPPPCARCGPPPRLLVLTMGDIVFIAPACLEII